MTPSAQIAATIDLLAEVQADGRPADAVASAFFRGRRYIGAKDRSAIAERLYAMLRRAARLGWWLARLGVPDTPRARVIAHLLLWEGRRAADLAALFSGHQYAPPVLAPAEREMAAALDGQTPEPAEMPHALRTECPDWAFGPLLAAFGDRVDAELAALLEPAPLDMRVNEFKASRDEVLSALQAAGITAAPTALSPLGIRAAGRPQIAGLPLFRNGLIEMQDEGSQVVALLTDVQPGFQVVDFCAGAGGKALALAARMRGRGRVVAADISKGRLDRAGERIRRAGLDNIEPRVLETERDRWVKRQKGKFDRVLIDAPCSGTGSWRRNPDARWRPLDLGALTALQASILDSAARLAKPGGRVVYATCSLLPDENEAQVERFLGQHPDFFVHPVAEIWPQALGTAPPDTGPFLKLTPARHGTDGFFAAVLERRLA